ncbi:unnamed protein product [Protopolystoma xenopodis]|uniref:Cadherin domain-containing protein n=1 Tax=Protopolystoma xenopodis TaxID=117903 RepID=A0A448WEL9_9PLAT|nr:unnamed protein product [Protopolystoma xenopodis]
MPIKRNPPSSSGGIDLRITSPGGWDSTPVRADADDQQKSNLGSRELQQASVRSLVDQESGGTGESLAPLNSSGPQTTASSSPSASFFPVAVATVPPVVLSTVSPAPLSSPGLVASPTARLQSDPTPDHFDIDSHSGQVFLVHPIAECRSGQTVKLLVVARDSGQPARSSTASLVVQVVSEDETFEPDGPDEQTAVWRAGHLSSMGTSVGLPTRADSTNRGWLFSSAGGRLNSFQQMQMQHRQQQHQQQLQLHQRQTGGG